jgi:hypothetical protein
VKALVGLGILVTGAIAAFAVYTFGRTENGGDRKTLGADKPRIYTLRPGDIVRVPAARTRCVASVEGGFRNLYCTRTPRGRYAFVFYEDSVVVFGPGGPDKTTASYEWER